MGRRQVRGSFLAFPALALTLLACSSGPRPADDVEPSLEAIIRDSNGVAIVEYASLQGADVGPRRIVLEDSVRIGRSGLEGDGDLAYYFGETRGVAKLADGRVAVADRQAHTIRIFDPDGTYHRSVGRSGRGPGEFRNIEGLYRVAGGIGIPNAISAAFATRYSAHERGARRVGAGGTTV